MKAGWELKTLEQIATTFGRGKSKHRPRNDAILYGGEYPFIQTGDVRNADHFISEFSQTYSEAGLAQSKLWPIGTICITIAANIAETGILGFDACFPDSVIGLVPNPAAADVGYVEYLLQSFKLRIQALGQGSAQANINLGTFEGERFPFPCIAEQKRIVSLLDEAFDGIATAKANAEKNLQNARAIFEGHLQSVFAQRGDGWISTTIGNSCILKSGTTVPVNIEKSAGDIPYVKVAEMTLPDNQDGITTSIRFINRVDVKAGWLIPAGAVIFPKRGGAILTNKKRLVLVDMCADLNIMSVIPTDKLTPEFLYFYFLTVDMRKLGTGSSIPQINNYDIGPLEISFPDSTRKQAEIADSIRSLESECQALESVYQRKIAALDDLKKSLLHQAFAGLL